MARFTSAMVQMKMLATLHENSSLLPGSYLVEYTITAIVATQTKIPNMKRAVRPHFLARFNRSFCTWIAGMMRSATSASKCMYCSETLPW